MAEINPKTGLPYPTRMQMLSDRRSPTGAGGSVAALARNGLAPTGAPFTEQTRAVLGSNGSASTFALPGGGALPSSGGYGAAMTGGGAFPSSMGVYGDYQAAYNRALNANETRYQQGLQGFDARHQRGMAMLSGLGQQELADIRQRGEEQKSNISQRMNDLGLAGTTVGDSLRTGVDRETNADAGRAQERIRQQQVATDAALSGDTLGFLERRTDAYPDLGSYVSLMQMAGQTAARQQGGSPVATGGYGAGASGLPPSMTPASYGSVIRGDTGPRIPFTTRQPIGPSTTVFRTPEEDRLARNPFLYGG